MKKSIFILVITGLLTLGIGDAWASNCLEADNISKSAVSIMSSNPAKAEEDLRKAVGLCEISASLRYNLALALYKQKKYGDAKAELEQSLELIQESESPDKKSDMARAYNLLAVVYLDVDHGRALENAKRAVSLESSNRYYQATLKAAQDSKPVGMGIDIECPEDPSYSDVEKDLPRTRMKNEDAVAVVIGNRDYIATDKVKFAINDACAIRKYLLDVLGYKRENIIFKANAQKSDFEEIFGSYDSFKGDLYSHVQPGISDVFVYYSGHKTLGQNNDKSYFVPIEAKPRSIERVGYSAEIFSDNLSKVPARSITVAIDACFAARDISGIGWDNSDYKLARLPNSVVLLSSDSGEKSSWYGEKSHGMFTYFFLKAIHNKNADSDKDGKLTFEEINSYVSDNSTGVPHYAKRVNSVEQHPKIKGKTEGVFVEY